MDKCSNCPQTREFPYNDKCPVCGENAIVDYCEPSVIWKCPKCGGLIGDGFWTECSQDNQRYTIHIQQAKYSQKQIMLISKLLNLNTVEVYKKIANEPLEHSLLLFELISAIKLFREAEIDYEVTPQLEYSRIFTCH